MQVFLKKNFYKLSFLPILLSLLFASCIGASSRIVLNANGSGTVTQEYRISLDLEEMGETEETEDKPPVPMGKEDIERTVERIEGLHLLSFTSRQDEKDMYITAEFAFDSPEALSELMNQDSQQMKVDMQGKKIVLHFSAGEQSENAFMEMIAEAFFGYDFSFSFTLPDNAKAVWFDENGKNVTQYPGTCTVQDKTVAYSVSASDLMYLEAALDLEISW